MKRCIPFLVFILACGEIYSQTNEPYGNLIFHDTLRLTPLHSWITIKNQEENVWEVGQPSKEFFNSGHQEGRAILTDSINNYPNNCYNYFYITIPWSENYWGEGILSFYHKFDTDTLTDGGFIDVSYNNGISWINILDDNNHISTNFIGLYEGTILDGKLGFSGKSNDWQYVELYWYWCAVTKSLSEELNYPIIRFNFISDDIDNSKEGWMIDDIVFRGYDIGGNIPINSDEVFFLYPNPSNEFVTLNRINLNAPNISIEFYNLSGILILRKPITSSTISVKDLDRGLYIFKIFEDNKVTKKGKLIKN